MFSRIFSLCLASLVCLLVGPALGQPSLKPIKEQVAGTCTTTTGAKSDRNQRSMSARTIVFNQTAEDKIIEVMVYRNDNKKNSKFLTKDDRAIQTTMNGSSKNNPDMNIRVDIYRRDTGARKAICNYIVKAREVTEREHEYTVSSWRLPEDEIVCIDVENICETCRISCAKTFNSGNARWTTTFTINE